MLLDDKIGGGCQPQCDQDMARAHHKKSKVARDNCATCCNAIAVVDKEAEFEVKIFFLFDGLDDLVEVFFEAVVVFVGEDVNLVEDDDFVFELRHHQNQVDLYVQGVKQRNVRQTQKLYQIGQLFDESRCGS